MAATNLLDFQTWFIYQNIAAECSHCYFMTDTQSFKASDIGLRTQKKILSRMANKTIAKTFIDETTSQILDNIYRLAKLHTGNKKEAERLVKNIIKIVIKIGILYRNDQFNDDEFRLVEKFRNKFHVTQLSIISFHEVDFSFDINYLQKSMDESRQLLKSLVRRHLTEKSLNRIDEIFHFFGDNRLLETAFKLNSPYKEVMTNLVTDLNKSLDSENSSKGNSAM